jgi:Fur family ferric uptake transcriptional regulator
MANTDFVRHTRQRQVILEELQKTTSHPTAAQLYERVRARLPKISLGTVYRNLELLVQNGMARKLNLSGSHARYDGDVHDHYHIRCLECGRLDDIKAKSTDVNPAHVKRLNGYKIVGHRLEFTGICKDCQNKHGRGNEDR